MPYLLFHYPRSRGSWGYIWDWVMKEIETHRHREKKYINTMLFKIHFKKLPMAHGILTSSRVSMSLPYPNGKMLQWHPESPKWSLQHGWSSLWLPCVWVMKWAVNDIEQASLRQYQSLISLFSELLWQVPLRQKRCKTEEQHGWKVSKFHGKEQYLGVTPHLSPCQSGEWLFHIAWQSLSPGCWWMVYGQMGHTETGKMA